MFRSKKKKNVDNENAALDNDLEKLKKKLNSLKSNFNLRPNSALSSVSVLPTKQQQLQFSLASKGKYREKNIYI